MKYIENITENASETKISPRQPREMYMVECTEDA